jgi:FtsH-binding integral membrane protein
MRSSNHPWTAGYLCDMVMSTTDTQSASKVVVVFDLFHEYQVLDPYRDIPTFIESLSKRPNTGKQELILKMIGSLETSKMKTPEFLLSSYVYNIRSAELRRRFWMSLMGVAGTLMYGLVIAFIASASLPYPSAQDQNLVSLANISAIAIVVFTFLVCIDKLSKIEKGLEPRFDISKDFLKSRRELKTQVVKNYVSFMEKKHEKWRNVLATLIRLYVTLVVSSIIAVLLQRLPAGVVLSFLIAFTGLFLILSALAHGRIRNIEVELSQKQRILRKFFTE